jgi:hypothetical protein
MEPAFLDERSEYQEQQWLIDYYHFPNHYTADANLNIS